MRKDNLLLAIILGLLIGTTILFLNTLGELFGSLERLAQYFMLVIICGLVVGMCVAVPIYMIYEKIKKERGLI